MEFNSILKNEEVRKILEKADVPVDRLKEIESQMLKSIQSQIGQNPIEFQKLKSGQLNAEIASHFADGLKTNIGLSDFEANQIKDVIPPLMNEYIQHMDSITLSNVSDRTKEISGDNEKKTHPKKPFSHPPKNDPHQGHGRQDDNKIGVQFTGGNQSGGSFKKKNKG